MYLRPRTLLACTLLVVSMAMCAPSAHARIGLVVGEPFGSFGTMMPAGHAGIYLDHLCAASPTQLRPCRPGELGVVLSRYHDLRATNRDWMATPASVFFYGVEDPADAPAYMTASLEAELRERYRENHLLTIAPDRIDKHGIAHKPPYGDWQESIGASFDRRLFVYTVETTQEEDEALLTFVNAAPNVRRYSLGHADCADFAADLLAFVVPAPLARSVLFDFYITSPKNLAHQMDALSTTSPELGLRVYEVPQVQGTLRRSRPLRDAAETFVKTKRYLVTVAILQPEIILTDWAIYEKKGKWTPGLDAVALKPTDWHPANALTIQVLPSSLLTSSSFAAQADAMGNFKTSAYSPASTSSKTVSDGIGFTAK